MVLVMFLDQIRFSILVVVLVIDQIEAETDGQLQVIMSFEVLLVSMDEELPSQDEQLQQETINTEVLNVLLYKTILLLLVMMPNILLLKMDRIIMMIKKKLIIGAVLMTWPF